MTNPNSAAQAADPDFVTTELRGIINVCEGSPTAVVSVERMRLWLSKLRAPVPDERAAVDPCGYVAVKVSAVDWLKDKFPALTIKAGLCERVGGRLYTITRLMRDHDAALASAPVAGEAVALELRGVPETIKGGAGFWRSCTGCHELNEGHDTGPYSAILGCHLGNGCGECGGIGAIWDSTDYQAMADDMARSMGQSVSAAPQASAEAFDFVAHLARQAEFSARTFGPGARVAGVCDHIRKELIEVETSGGDLKEWVDVIILGLDGAWRSGATPQQIIAAIVAKQAKNEARTWPDWRTVDPNKAIEHQRTAAPCTCPSGGGSLRHPCAAHPAKASGNGGQEWSDS